MTDANLFLGRLLPEFFPKIFGKNEDQGLDVEASKKVLQELADQVNQETGKNLTADEVAYGFLTVANETMTRPIRSITEAKGHDTSKHRLATFGGAGGQHAVAIAESLGIRQILIHRYSSVLSAYGMALADVVDERQEPESTVWKDNGKVVDDLKAKMEKLKEKSRASLKDQGFEDKEIAFEEYLNMRYRGTESALMIIKPSEEDAKDNYNGNEWDFEKAFIKQHRYEFGFTLDDRDIFVDDVRVRGIGKSFRHSEETVDEQLKTIKRQEVAEKKNHSTKQVYFEGGRKDTPIYKLEDLDVGDSVPGPAMLADGTQTIVVPPKAAALITKTHVIIDIEKENHKDQYVELSLYFAQTNTPIGPLPKMLKEKLTPLCLASLDTVLWPSQNKWVELFRRRVSAPMSRSVSISPAPSLMLRVVSLQMPLICQSILDPCRPAFVVKPRFGKESLRRETSLFPTTLRTEEPIFLM